MCTVWATLFTESRGRHVTLSLSLSCSLSLSVSVSETERPQSMKTTKFKEAILVSDQLDAQILVHLLQSSTCTCFKQYLAHPHEVKLY
jgi:hypothetical protein